jgi:hypothetical protein
MKAYKVTGTITESGELILSEPIKLAPGQVEVIVLQSGTTPERVERSTGRSQPESQTQQSPSEISTTSPETELQFEALASEWQAAMAGSSFMAEKTSHPAYQKIIEMGSAAVPLLLRELERKPTHWFAALKAITGANPVKPEESGRIKQMAEAWIEWGRKQGYEW